jgi:hypothetical protein
VIRSGGFGGAGCPPASQSRFSLLSVSVLVSLLFAPPIRAADAAPPPANYVAGFLGSTLAYKPPGGSWDGWQKDFSTTLGYGRQLTPKLALELDLGPTWVDGKGYSSFALVPGLVWTINPHVYAAARFVVPVDPETNFVLLPGIGLSHAFGRVMPTLELNLSSAVGRGDPDLGVTLTAGLLVFF